MEPDIMALHPTSPTPLDIDEEEVGLEKEEFGDFRGHSVLVSCTPLGFTNFIEPPLSLTQPCPATKPAPHQSYYCLNNPVKQSQPASTVSSGSHLPQMNMENQDCNAEMPVHLTNGYAERENPSGIHYRFSIVGTCSPKGESGFADFTVFTEQTTHPWCCGFSPVSSKEQWEGREEGTNLVKQICTLGQEVIKNSEPKSHCAEEANEKICSGVKDCDKRAFQPQEAAAPHGKECEGKCGDGWSDCGHFLLGSYLQISESKKDSYSEEEKSNSNVHQTFSVYESASEDLGSFCEDLSFEGVSADLEPNVSSLTSLEKQSDWDKTDDEDEGEGNCIHSDSFVPFRIANLRQTEVENDFHHCIQLATQETPTTSTFCVGQSHLPDNEDEPLDLNQFKHYRDKEHVQNADLNVLCLGSLPSSDSFADFCSAATQEEEDQNAQQDITWRHFREKDSSLPRGGESEEEQDWAGKDGALPGSSCQAPLSCCIEQLFQSSYPERVVTAVYSEDEILSLDTLFHIQNIPDSNKEEKPKRSSAQWMKENVWWQHQDLHSSAGLQFQWRDSHTNRTLLGCLGVDTRDIVFSCK